MYEICIPFFIIYFLEIFNFLILIIILNMNEKNSNDKNVKFFSYGLITGGSFIFFILGGINSFLFIIIFFLLINTNFFILKEDNKHICYIFIIFCYIILSLRANFIDLIYILIFCIEYKILLYKDNVYINMILNSIFSINYNYFGFVLFSLCVLSFLINLYKKNKNFECNENKKCEKILILNFCILSTLFIQTNGYESLELLIIYISLLFQMLMIIIVRNLFLDLLVNVAPIMIIEGLEYLFIENKNYNQKGIWINILYYLILLY